MKTPISVLRTLSCQKNPPPLARMIEEVLTEYLKEYPVETNLAAEIALYLRYVQVAAPGTYVSDYQFHNTLSTELIDFFKLVKLRENAQQKAALPIIVHCDNALAAGGHSPKVIFEQACLLENALANTDGVNSLAIAIENKLSILIQGFSPKFAELILKAKNPENLRQLFSEAFNKQLCNNLEKVGFAYDMIEKQYTSLFNSAFLDSFYQQNSLSDKSNYVDEYCHYLEQTTKNTEALEYTLACLMKLIQAKAYAPCRAKQYQLANDPTMTVAELNAEIDHWTNIAWLRHQDTELIEELNELLDADQQWLEDWETISAQTWQASQKKHNRPSTIRPAQPAFEIFSFRYTTGDPNADPRRYLVQENAAPVIDRPNTPIPQAITLAVADHEVLGEQMAALTLNVMEPPKRSRSRSF